MNHEHDVLSRLVDYHDHIAAPGVPLVDDVARGRRRVRRNRALLAGGAALAAVAVVASLAQLNGRSSADDPLPADRPGLSTPLVAPASPLDLRELGFHLEPAPDLALTGHWAIDRDWQSAGVQVLGGDSSGRLLDVRVYYQGRPMSNMPGTNNGEPVTVNGVPGTFAEHHGDGFHTAVLAWEYAQDSWARVDAGWTDAELPSDLRSKMLTAAEAVRPGGEALRVPVRVGTLPASLPSLKALQGVSVDFWDGDWQWWLSLDDGIQIHATAETGIVCEADDGSYHKASFTYRGHSGCLVDGQQIGLGFDDAQVFIDFVDAEPKPPIDDLKQVLADLTVASENPTTWFDLRTALGG